jgi:hypothetical protein
MAYSYIDHTGTGTSGPFSFSSIQLLEETVEPVSSQIDVYRNGVLLTFTTDYTINTVSKTVTFTGAQPNLLSSETLRIARDTRKSSRYVDYVDSTNVTSELLDLDSNQLFFIAQEAIDIQGDAMVRNTSGQWEGRGYRITNLGAATSGTDAVTLNQLQAAVVGALPATLSGQGTASYTGDGSTSVFSLPASISTITDTSDVSVYVNGIRQRPTTDYTIASGNITFIPAPANADNLLLSWPEGVISGIITANSVATSAIQDDAVTVAKIDEGSSGQILKTVGSAVSWVTPVHTDITDFDTGVRENRLDQMTSPTASVSMNSNKITSLATGVSGTDAANVNNITTYKWCYSVPVFNDGTGTNKDRTYIITGAPFEIGGAMINVSLVDSGTDFTLTFVVPAISGSHSNSSTNGSVHVYSISPGGVGHGWRLAWDRLTTTSISLRVVETQSNATITTRAANVTLFRRD